MLKRKNEFIGVIWNEKNFLIFKNFNIKFITNLKFVINDSIYLRINIFLDKNLLNYNLKHFECFKFYRILI